MRFVCSANPSPSTKTSGKGNHWWKRDVYHATDDARQKTLCGVRCSEWLVIKDDLIDAALSDPNFCARCATVSTRSPSPIGFPNKRNGDGGMSERIWQPLATAPRDGTEIQARGYNWGDRSRGRHRVLAKFVNDRWIDADDEDSTLHYLEEWRPATRPSSFTAGEFGDSNS